MATASTSTSSPGNKEAIHIVTVNVRFDGKARNPVPIPPEGAIPPHWHYPWVDAYAEQPWAERRSRLVDALLATGPVDIVGFQEVLHNQLLDLQALLGPTFDHAGVGRDDGKEAGEYAPIFWNKDKFELVRWRTVWLSPTPDVPGSKGWDANQTREATIVTLSFADGPNMGQLVHVVNTHFDDAGKRARAESSLIIREQVKKWVERFEDHDESVRPPPAPVIVIGDFNSPASEEGYQNMTSTHPLPNGARSFSFVDSLNQIQTRHTALNGARSPAPRQSTVYGPLNTYTGFAKPGKAATTRIDFILLATSQDPDQTDRAPASESEAVKIRGDWEITRYGVIDNWIEEGDVQGWTGRWSDHRAVRVKIEKV